MVNGSKEVRVAIVALMQGQGISVYDTYAPADAPSTHIIFDEVVTTSVDDNCGNKSIHNVQLELVTGYLTGGSRMGLDSLADAVFAAMDNYKLDTTTYQVEVLRLDRALDAPDFGSSVNYFRKLCNFEVLYTRK
jgi:hypothetical protein